MGGDKSNKEEKKNPFETLEKLIEHEVSLKYGTFKQKLKYIAAPALVGAGLAFLGSVETFPSESTDFLGKLSDLFSAPSLNHLDPKYISKIKHFITGFSLTFVVGVMFGFAGKLFENNMKKLYKKKLLEGEANFKKIYGTLLDKMTASEDYIFSQEFDSHLTLRQKTSLLIDYAARNLESQQGDLVINKKIYDTGVLKTRYAMDLFKEKLTSVVENTPVENLEKMIQALPFTLDDNNNYSIMIKNVQYEGRYKDSFDLIKELQDSNKISREFAFNEFFDLAKYMKDKNEKPGLISRALKAAQNTNFLMSDNVDYYHFAQLYDLAKNNGSHELAKEILFTGLSKVTKETNLCTYNMDLKTYKDDLIAVILEEGHGDRLFETACKNDNYGTIEDACNHILSTKANEIDVSKSRLIESYDILTNERVVKSNSLGREIYLARSALADAIIHKGYIMGLLKSAKKYKDNETLQKLFDSGKLNNTQKEECFYELNQPLQLNTNQKVA